MRLFLEEAARQDAEQQLAVLTMTRLAAWGDAEAIKNVTKALRG